MTTNETAWTPEPWYVTDHISPHLSLYHPLVNGKENPPKIVIATVYCDIDGLSRRNLKRASACVNACRGMADPEKEIAALRAGRAESAAEIERLRGALGEIADGDWNPVSCPIAKGESIPAERRCVLVWVRGSHLPFCGYIRYAAGDRECPFFVVYHGNQEISAEVLAWCDCLPDSGPDVPEGSTYSREQRDGRGFPARATIAKVGGA